VPEFIIMIYTSSARLDLLLASGVFCNSLALPHGGLLRIKKQYDKAVTFKGYISREYSWISEFIESQSMRDGEQKVATCNINHADVLIRSSHFVVSFGEQQIHIDCSIRIATKIWNSWFFCENDISWYYLTVSRYCLTIGWLFRNDDTYREIHMQNYSDASNRTARESRH